MERPVQLFTAFVNRVVAGAVYYWCLPELPQPVPLVIRGAGRRPEFRRAPGVLRQCQGARLI
jgi:hypothetical protein